MKKGKGFYQVKCSRTSTLRDVTQLSTGEKNVIAFLYFIEKLNEINESKQIQQNRLIVFDDPMNSNDDTMQYLIIDELQRLMRSIKLPNKFILLTHNNHFYLNVKYGRKCDNNNDFIRFMSNGTTTKFVFITKQEEDFKTSYEALWNEVMYLYENENTSPEMLLNPIRRIIETYINFNGISIMDFYKNQSGAKKLFDVNSHSIDDLEADLNGRTKKDIIELVKGCFNDNNAKAHFEKLWKLE